MLLQVFSGVCDGVQQPHSEGDIFTHNLIRAISDIDKNSSKVGQAVNLKSSNIYKSATMN